MLETIGKIGNSQGLIFDAALLDMAGLELGDQVHVTVAPGGSMVVTPIRSAPPVAAVRSMRTRSRWRRALFYMAGNQAFLDGDERTAMRSAIVVLRIKRLDTAPIPRPGMR